MPFGDLEGIDVDAGLARVGGKKKIYLDLLKRFVNSQGDVDIQIKNALDVDDIELVKRLAHTTKGVSGNIGAMDLHKAAESLEGVISSNERDAVLKELDNFSKQLKNIVNVLEEALSISELEEVAPEITQTVTPDQLHPLLIKLHALLTDDDGEAVDYLEEISKYLKSGLNEAELNRLTEKVNQFDFEEALEDLNQIAANLNISMER